MPWGPEIDRPCFETANELLVRTTFQLPALGVTPVLFIGEVRVSKYESVAANLYRFFLFDMKRVSIGAPISLGWPYATESKIPTTLTFQPNEGQPII